MVSSPSPAEPQGEKGKRAVGEAKVLPFQIVKTFSKARKSCYYHLSGFCRVLETLKKEVSDFRGMNSENVSGKESLNTCTSRAQLPGVPVRRKRRTAPEKQLPGGLQLPPWWGVVKGWGLGTHVCMKGDAYRVQVAE